MPVVSIASSDIEINSMNLETPRVQELIPREVRQRASNFVSLMEDYYTYMNAQSQPTQRLNSLLNECDIDQVTENFLNGLQAEIAAYMPSPYVIDRKKLYKRIVKYSYNTRGTIESAETFFRIFFDSEVEITPFDELPSLQANGLLAEDGQPNASLIRQEWLPYSYLINTQIPIDIWRKAYKEIIHPAGFRFFALLLFVSITYNAWAYPSFQSPGYNFDYKNRNLIWFVKPPVGSHSPYVQPGWIGKQIALLVFGLFADSIEGTEEYHTYLALIRLLGLYQEGQLNRNRIDHITWTKYYDQTPIRDYQDYTLEQMDTLQHDIYENAKFIALGSWIIQS
jgi:hypothetical protein